MKENTGFYVTYRRVNAYTYMYRVFLGKSAMIREKVPYGKLHM